MSTHIFFACILLGSVAAQAQNYSITSHTIDGGGGTSSAGPYAITGTIGQPDASEPSTGGSFSLSGGFFAQYMALQQTGAPFLKIRAAGGNVQIVWGAQVPGWILQYNNTDLSAPGWTDVVGAPTVFDSEQFHTFTKSGGRVFFRLRKL